MSVVNIAGARYVAVPSWDGQQWQVRVEDWDYQHRGDTSALVWTRSARTPVCCWLPDSAATRTWSRVSVEPELPKDVERALQAAEGHIAEATRHVDAAVTALRRANVCGHDVAALVGERDLRAGPRRPLLVPNSEIASYGLSRRPELVGVEWPDRQAVLTCCRRCVETNPRAWQNHPDGTSAAIYDASGRCDLCGRDLAGRDGRGVGQ